MSIKSTSKDLFKRYGSLSFGEVVRSFREADEMSQVEFAKKLGMSSANLCDIEKGRKVPSPRRAVTIAKKLGISEILLLQLALQGMLEKDKLKFKVSVAS